MKLELSDNEFCAAVWSPIAFIALCTLFFGLYSCDKVHDQPPKVQIEKQK